MPLGQGQVLKGRYRIVGLISQGGMGAIYKAWDLNLQCHCAVKENLEFTQDAKDQFTREALMLAQLMHPNLPRVTDHFFIPNLGQYLVMEYVEGDDLQQLLEQRQKLTEIEVMPYTEQICSALEYLHGQDEPVIHRDIKPANIKITPDGRAVLVDFGIAKTYTDGKSTTIGARAVTPGYSPPEQYGYGRTDARSDIYALGATLYTLLTGTEPPESVHRLTGNTLPHPHDTSPQTGATILKAMALEPKARFQTATEFYKALTSNSNPSFPRWALVIPAVVIIALLAFWMVRANSTPEPVEVAEVVTIMPSVTATVKEGGVAPAEEEAAAEGGGGGTGIDGPEGGGEPSAPAVPAGGEEGADGRVMTVFLGSKLVDCLDEDSQACMLVKTNPDDDYSLFDKQIEGFAFEEGYEYELLIKVASLANEGSQRYTLVKTVNKTLAQPTVDPPTEEPPAEDPPTEMLPTEVPPTDVPPTDVPPTDVPPTDVPPTDVPPTDVPPTDVPPTDVPPTDVPPTDVPPTQVVVQYPIEDVLGNSYDGHLIKAYQFGDGSRSVLLVGGLHAGFAPASVSLAETVIANYRDDPDRVPDNVTLYVISNANPDSDWDPGGKSGRLNGNGVDLNRNFGCNWSKSAEWKDQSINPGSGPFSEPETRVLRDFIQTHDPSAVIFYEARATNGMVAPGNCNGEYGGSGELAQIYIGGSGYPLYTGFSLTGDGSDWLASQGIPSIAILFKSYDSIGRSELLANLNAIEDVLAYVSRR